MQHRKKGRPKGRGRRRCVGDGTESEREMQDAGGTRKERQMSESMPISKLLNLLTGLISLQRRIPSYFRLPRLHLRCGGSGEGISSFHLIIS
jgi:hypothetical protein